VKEDILSRYGELGIYVDHGKLSFYPCLLRKNEFVAEASNFEYINLGKESKSIALEANSLVFTYCQIPIVYQIAEKDALEVHFTDGSVKTFDALQASEEVSEQIFKREGTVDYIKAHVEESQLK
jgi:hypothetical protein